MNEYRIDKGTIYSEKGLPWGPRWFCDGRMAIEADGSAITQIDYFGQHTAVGKTHIVFRKRFWDGIRFIMNTDSRRCPLKPRECEIYPYGFTSHSEGADYRIFLADERLFFTVIPAADCNLDIEFYDDSVFYPETHPHARVDAAGRTAREWEPFRLEDGELRSSFTDNGTATYVSFSSDCPLSFSVPPRRHKSILTMNGLKAGGEYVLCVSISTGRTKDYTGWQELLRQQQERYRKIAERAPVLKSSRPLLNQFFALAPLYHESLKTVDIPGVLRAQSTHYWVWGWDSMTSAESFFYWGDEDFAGQMLACFAKYGLAHCYAGDMSSAEAAPVPADGMYLVLLDRYRQSGGDAAPFYPFAKELTERIFDTGIGDTGLCIGTSLYPDFRELVCENGQDISAFNNTVCYCAVRSMERIAAALGDSEMADRAKAFADRTKANFERTFYNPEISFIDSSIDAITLEGRGLPTNNAVKWESSDCADLITGHADEYLKTYENRLVSPSGLRPAPEDHPCYDLDANQLHCWWPVMSEFYIQLVTRSGRKDLLEQYLSWVEYWSERLMCPEGISCYDNDPSVDFDNWNSRLGTWHGYSIRGFYNAVVHACFGVNFDEDGLHILPSPADEGTELCNLHFGKKSFDIRLIGEGGAIREVKLNGRSLGAVSLIAHRDLEEHNQIEILRG